MSKRYTPSHAAPGRHEASRGGKKKRKPSKRPTPTPEAVAPVKDQRRIRQRGRRLRHTVICVLAAAFVLAAVMAVVSLLHRDGLKGTWALDDTTVYEFDGRGHGVLSLPLGSYEFSYSVEDNVLSMDFTDEAASDAVYSYSVDNAVLTLDTNTGSIVRLEKQK